MMWNGYFTQSVHLKGMNNGTSVARSTPSFQISGSNITHSPDIKAGGGREQAWTILC